MRARDVATGLALLVALGLATAGAASAAPSGHQLSSVPPPGLTTPAENSVVRTATPQLAGTGEPGDTVVVSEAGFIRCVGTVRPDGHWSCTSTTPLTDGVHHLTATQTDQAGTMSGMSSTLDVTVQAGSAPAPSTTPPSPTTGSASVSPTSSVVAPTRFASPSSTSAVSIKTSTSKDDNVLLAVIAVLALACTIAVAAFVKLRPRRRG